MNNFFKHVFIKIFRLKYRRKLAVITKPQRFSDTTKCHVKKGV